MEQHQMTGSARVQGELWGAAARDWADLQEDFVRQLWEAMLNDLGVTTRTRFLDAGCGAGGASVLAAQRGARVFGFDASRELLAIAAERVADGDFRCGDLEDLPYEDASFDAIVACNSVQYCNDRRKALQELKRVCSPRGKIAVATWGAVQDCEMRDVLAAVASALPEAPQGEDPFALSVPGALEDLLGQVGLRVARRASVDCALYHPDPETFWRGVSSAGPFQAAMRIAGEEPIKRAVLDATQPYRTSGGGVRLDNRFVYVIAGEERA